MHILHVIDSLSVGGAERMLVELANATAADGHHVSVCVTRSGLDLASELHPDIKLLVLGRQKRFDYPAMQKLAHYVESSDVQLLHVHGRSSFAFVAFIKRLGLTHRPIVLHDHYNIETNPSVPLWFRLWGRFWLAEYVGVYDKLAEWATNAGVSPGHVRFIGNALDLTRPVSQSNCSLRDEFRISSDVMLGVVICGIRPEKGIDLLLQSVSQIRSVTSPVILVIGGDRDRAYAENCRQEAGALGLQEKIHFIGERPDAATLASGADFALMPSRSESGPLVLIEYMAAGLPIVAFEVGGISKQSAQLGVPGFVHPLDIGAFACELEKLLRMTTGELRDRGQIGRGIAQEHFSIQAKLAQWYEVYNGALGCELG